MYNIMNRKFNVVLLTLSALFLSVSLPTVSSLYRTFDGSGNNIKNPKWGKANEPFVRAMSTFRYDDGVSTFRKSVNGQELPKPRLLSSAIAIDKNFTHNSIALMTMQWGQFLDHDLSLAIFDNDSTCCDISPAEPECVRIDVPTSDPFYSQFGVTCLKFRRSKPYTEVNLSHREQFSVLTAYIDGSQVYGSSLETDNELRLFQNGKLRTFGTSTLDEETTDRGNEYVYRSEKDFLPKNTDKACEAINATVCFLAGDARVNLTPGLVSQHALWMREHNRVAMQLQYRNPSWDDEKVFQEARKIVIAEMQHITYNEFLPVVLGSDIMAKERLELLRSGFSYEYNQYAIPNMMHEFSTAAYRFGHTLLQGEVQLRESDSSNTISKTEKLGDVFFNPEFVGQQDYLEKYIRGQVTQGMQRFDRHFTKEVAGNLFKSRAALFGQDLVSLNILRGRDHGIHTYNDMREYCGLPRAIKFENLAHWIPHNIVQHLRAFYWSPDDIDLFVGGVVETSVSGGIVGPTFGCIIADQFHRLKVGDRYWYENGGLPHSFTEAQLRAIRNVTMAGIICENTEGIHTIQPKVFLQPGETNKPVNCEDIPRVNFKAWGL